MKKFIVLLSVLVMLITAFCGCTENSPATNLGDSTVSYYNFKTDCQFNMTNPPFEHYAAKGTEGYFLLNDGYLYFADISTDSATILCNKPNCLHNEVYLNTDCNAYVGVVGSITYNEGNIYYVGSNAQDDDGSSLMRVATDGSGTRENVYSNKYNTDKWAVHRGCFYNAYREYHLEDKLENINRSRLVVEKVPLSGKGEAEILFDSVDFLQDSSFTYIVIFDNYLYYSYQYYTDNDELVEKLVCYDLENHTEKEITIPEGDTNPYEFGINYIYPLGDKLIFKAGYEIYQCDLNAENTEKVLTIEDEYHNIFADGTYLYEDNLANFMHSDLLSIEQAPSRVLKVYDSKFKLVDILNVGDYEMSFRPVDEMCFLSIDNNGVMSYFDKSEIGKVKGGNWENRTLKTLS